MKDKPLVCIIILNWEGEKVINDELLSLKKTDYPNHKIIVVDNGSKDKSVKIISKFHNVELLKLKENIGYTKGFNYGWNYCMKKYSPKYICNLNNDLVVVKKDWLSLMVKELEKKKSNGICENQETFPNEEKRVMGKNPVREITFVGGASMLVKIDVIKKIGGLDENFFFGADDKDFGLRAIKVGFKIIHTDLSEYVHRGSFSYQKSNKDFIYKHQSYGEMLYFFRHGTASGKSNVPLKQFLRVFLSYGKDSNNPQLRFHWSFIKRFFIFLNSLNTAKNNYHIIKNEMLK